MVTWKFAELICFAIFQSQKNAFWVPASNRTHSITKILCIHVKQNTNLSFPKAIPLLSVDHHQTTFGFQLMPIYVHKALFAFNHNQLSNVCFQLQPIVPCLSFHSCPIMPWRCKKKSNSFQTSGHQKVQVESDISELRFTKVKNL